jgi:AraC family transcriptional regulator
MELMSANLGTDELTLQTIAAECELSTSHFARAFRQSTGQAPHQWLMVQRIAKAKDLLQNSTVPLAELALICGFGNQAHFSQAFKTRVGTSPGTWRRYRIK